MTRIEIYCGDPSHGDEPGANWWFNNRGPDGICQWYEEASDPSLVGRMRRAGQKATTQVLQGDHYIPSAQREHEVFAAPIRVRYNFKCDCGDSVVVRAEKLYPILDKSAEINETRISLRLLAAILHH